MLVKLFRIRCRFRMLRFGIFCFGGSQASRLSLGELDSFPSDRRGVEGAGRPGFFFFWGGGGCKDANVSLQGLPDAARPQAARTPAAARPCHRWSASRCGSASAAGPSTSPPASCRTAVHALRQQRGRAAPHAVRPAACRPHAASGRGVAAPWRSPGPSGNALQSGLLAGRA